jgi:arylsulfatase A-like enzyme
MPPPALSMKLALLAPLFTCLAFSVLHAAPPRPPNLVVILADDLGWGELGCFGQQLIQTPRLDRLAAEGMRFTQFYAGATVCAPSRSVLMTGRHQGRTRIRGNSTNPTKLALHRGDLTVAEFLKTAGYRNGMFGKWGLGESGPAYSGLPLRKGFDTFFGYLNHYHAHNHFPDHLWRNEERLPLPNRSRPVGDYGGSVTDDPVLFADDLITDEVLKFVGRHQHEPFFVYWSPVLPHANNERTATLGNGAQVPDFGPYAGRDWSEQDKGHAAMITRLDSYVGRLLDHLRLLGLDQNTIILFSSDNGPHNESKHNLDRFRPAGPFTGTKRSLTEGGIRVPTIAWGPGLVPAGATSGHAAYLGDWFATAAELAGSKLPAGLDSVSFAAVLQGRPAEQAAHDYLYWEFNERGFAQAVLYQGRWKFIRTTEPARTVRLHDLASDPAEAKNIAADHADIVARIETYLATARLEDPAWPATTRID